jgi:amino acid transporter
VVTNISDRSGYSQKYSLTAPPNARPLHILVPRYPAPAIRAIVPTNHASVPTSRSPTPINRHASSNKLRLLPLVAATYFMVAGGPYGLEDVLGKAGYLRALLLLAVVPVIWSLPTSLMVGELASAIPAEGGYYIWVRRALGRFWGFQEAWLSLAASVFDMAIYPVIFVDYLSRLAPTLTAGHRGVLWALAVVIVCTLWNMRGARVVGVGSVILFCALLSPFVVLIVFAMVRWHGHGSGTLLQPVATPDLAGAISVTLWNYMGWDNASTVAQEVEDPQRNYPRAMVGAAALVALTYILPLLAVGLAGVDATQFSTGAWTDAARTIAGPLLALAIVIGGMINGSGMFNALMLSYTRVPYAMAEDGMLSGVLARLFIRRNARGVPWVSVLFCAAIWALALNFTFERLISIDLVLYGAALLLEFVALVVLRLREPELNRPFRIPGGTVGAIAAGIGPALLIVFAVYAARGEHVLGMNALLFASLVAVGGAAVYLLTRLGRRPA